MSTDRAAATDARAVNAPDPLPSWSRVLAVVSRPAEVRELESVLADLEAHGARVSVLVLDEAPDSDAAAARPEDLGTPRLLTHTDAAWNTADTGLLVKEVRKVLHEEPVEGLVVVDPDHGDPESTRGAARQVVAAIVLQVCDVLGLAVLASPGPGASPRWLRDPRATARTHVRWCQGDQFEITVRGHQVVVDQPPALGGSDTGPTPTELFVASLTSCVAFYARRYLARHEIQAHGLEVVAHYAMGQRPARVASVTLELTVPSLPEERRRGLLAQASHCTVHNTLTDAVDVRITLAENADEDADEDAAES